MLSLVFSWVESELKLHADTNQLSNSPKFVGKCYSYARIRIEKYLAAMQA